MPPGAPSKHEFLTVGKAARLAGVPASTVRFYEREGLVAPAAKSPAGYRLYDGEAVARLRFVRAAQGIGLPLKDIRAVLEMDARTSRAQMRTLLESRLQQVETKLKQLTTVRDALTSALARCRRSGTADCCSVLVSLSVKASDPIGVDDHEALHLQDGRGDRPLRGRPPGSSRRVPERGDARERRTGTRQC
jgi:MerR family copper efflux transcriptional regulator